MKNNHIDHIIKKILGDNDKVQIPLRDLFEQLDPIGKINFSNLFSFQEPSSLSIYLNANSKITLYKASSKVDSFKLYLNLPTDEYKKIIIIPAINGVLEKVDLQEISIYSKVVESYIGKLPTLIFYSDPDFENKNIVFNYYLDPSSEFYDYTINELKHIHLGCNLEQEDIDYYITPFLKIKVTKLTFTDKVKLELDTSDEVIYTNE